MRTLLVHYPKHYLIIGPDGSVPGMARRSHDSTRHFHDHVKVKVEDYDYDADLRQEEHDHSLREVIKAVMSRYLSSR
jgi:hypothetical protein